MLLRYRVIAFRRKQPNNASNAITNMAKEILINIQPQEKRAAIVSAGRLEEFYIERPQDKTIVGIFIRVKLKQSFLQLARHS